MYGCNGKCCDRVIDPETGEGQYFICGGIAGIVALIVFGI